VTLAPVFPQTEAPTRERSAADGLREALVYLDDGRHWTQGTMQVPEERTYCALGAIWRAAFGEVAARRTLRLPLGEESVAFYARMLRAFFQALGKNQVGYEPLGYLSLDKKKRGEYWVPIAVPITCWNDAPERTYEHVEAVFRNAIAEAEKAEV
jgi:hypothetical protein